MRHQSSRTPLILIPQHDDEWCKSLKVLIIVSEMMGSLRHSFITDILHSEFVYFEAKFETMLEKKDLKLQSFFICTLRKWLQLLSPNYFAREVGVISPNRQPCLLNSDVGKMPQIFGREGSISTNIWAYIAWNRNSVCLVTLFSPLLASSYSPTCINMSQNLRWSHKVKDPEFIAILKSFIALSKSFISL